MYALLSCVWRFYASSVNINYMHVIYKYAVCTSILNIFMWALCINMNVYFEKSYIWTNDTCVRIYNIIKLTQEHIKASRAGRFTKCGCDYFFFREREECVYINCLWPHITFNLILHLAVTSAVSISDVLHLPNRLSNLNHT